MEKKQDKKPHRKIGLRYFWRVFGINTAIITVIVIAILSCLTTWLDGYTHHDERVEVPDLTGFDADEAQRFLERMGLNSMVIDSVYTDARPGVIIEQLPVGGLPVKKGRLVYLTMNARQVRMVEMPDVREFSSRQAASKLREKGFVIDSTRYVAHEFDDLVLDVTCHGVPVVPGKQYPIRSHVTMHVSSTTVRVAAENDSTETLWME